MAVQNNLISAWRDSSGNIYTSTATNESQTWSSSISVGQQCQGQPAVALLGGTYCVAYTAPGSGAAQIHACTSLRSNADTMTWSQPNATLGLAVAGTSPALATFGGVFYMAYVQYTANNGIYIGRSPDGSTWAPPFSIGQACLGSPSLAVFNGKLWIAFRASNSTGDILVCSSSDGTSWSANTRVGQACSGSPSVTAFNGRLWISYTSTTGNNVMVCSSPDGLTWTGSPTSVGQTTSGSPAIAGLDGTLWIAFTAADGSGRVLYTTSSDGAGWSANVSTGKVTSTSPALAATPLYQGMLFDQQFTKVFGDKTYQYTASVLHQGTLVAFAMDSTAGISYSVLDFNDSPKGGIESDAGYWSSSDNAGAAPRAVPFPQEVRKEGFGSFCQLTLQPVSFDSRPSTGQLTQGAPFQVLSDGTYIYLFRRSNQAGMVDQYGNKTSSAANAAYTFAKNALLVDRYALSGTTLSLVPEVRFQRSRSKDFPASNKDSLSPVDMNNVAFVEPTHELGVVQDYSSFTVTLVPTQVAGSWRWQIFALSNSGMLESYSILQASDGLFDFAGPLSFACPNDSHTGVQSLPGACSQPCGRVLQPRVTGTSTTYYCPTHLGYTSTKPGYCSKVCGLTFAQVPTAGTAEACLALGNQAMVDLGSFALPGQSGSFTIELWCQRTQDAAGTLLYQNATGGIELDFSAKGALTCGSLSTYEQTKDLSWHHYALVYDISTQRRSLYKDGVLHGTDTSNVTIPAAASNIYLGARTTAQGVTAAVNVDELRFWGVALSQAEIQTNMRARAAGDEKALAHYFRLDEGSGTTVRDLTGGSTGTVQNPGSASCWVASGAPIGQAQGLRHERIAVSPMRGNLTAQLYYQQESLPSSQGGASKLHAAAARLMLAFDTPSADHKTFQVGVLDFAIGADGQLAQTPDAISLPTLSGSGKTQVPLALISMDGRGLTVSGGVLDFTNTQAYNTASPTLYSSVTGALTLYYNTCANNENVQLTWASFNTTVVRPQIQIQGSNPGTLVFAAKTASADFNDLSIAIAQPSGSSTLTVTITHGGYTETWTGVPTDAQSFVAVLNAQPLPDPETTYVYSGEGAQVTTNRADADLSTGSLLVAATAVPLDSSTTTFTVTPTPRAVTCASKGGQSGQSAAWQAPPQANAFPLSGIPLRLATLAEGAVPPTPTWDLTLEAWVNPSQSGSAYLVCQSTGGSSPSGYYLALGSGVSASIVKSGIKVSAQSSAAVVPVGQWSHVAAVFRQKSAVMLDGKTGYLDCGNDSSLSITGDLTLEAWVQLTASASTAKSSTMGIISKGVLGDGTSGTVQHVPYALYLDDGTLMFAYSRGDGAMSFAVGPAFPTDGKAHSVAVTRVCNQSYYDSATGNIVWDQITFYIDGAQKAQLKAYTDDYVTRNAAAITDDGGSLVIGRVGEIGVNLALATSTYKAASGNTANASIYGSSANTQLKYSGTAGLAGATKSLDAPVTTWAGRISQIRVWNSALSSGQVCKPLSDGGTQPAAAWTFEERQGIQSAASAGSSTAMFMNGVTWDQSQDMSLLATAWTIYLNGTAQPTTASSDSFTPDSWPQLYLGGHGSPPESAATNGALQGQLAEVRIWNMQRTATQVLENMHRPLDRDASSGAILDNPMSLLAYYALDSVGTSAIVDRSMMGGANLIAYTPFTFGKTTITAPSGISLAGSYTIEFWSAPVPGSLGNTPILAQSGGPTIAFSGGSTAGTIQLSFALSQTQQVYYAFNDANWHHWACVYDASLGTYGTLEILRDGVRVGTFALTSAYTGGANAITLGGSGNAAYVSELRIWNVARQASDITADMNRPLTGKERSLAALWPFCAGNTNTIASGKAYPAPPSQPSTAPCGAEMPEAWCGFGSSANSGCNARGACPLGLAEYGVNEIDAAGNMTGALKRGYSLVQSGQWLLTNGFKVGPLIVEWVGQVQFKPTLLGYIEGAPPVPGENMIQSGVDYRGQSSVQLNVADEVDYTYSASRDKGFDYSVDTSLTAGFQVEDLANTPVLAVQLFQSKLLAGVEYTASGGTSKQEGVEPTVGISQAQLSEMDLDGYYYDAGDGLGKRFVPRNVGYALVKSGVADQYALRLATTGAIVGYQMVVNPKIPADWNIITFEINPYYIRQGCLDGKFGYNDLSAGTSKLKSDPHFPATGGPVDASYFRANEAYALKSKIVRDEQQLATQYASYDAVKKGNKSWVDTDLIDKSLSSAADMTMEDGLDALIEPADDSGDGSDDSQDPTQIVKRSMWNTYLWTAYGGLFSETEQTLDGYSETLGGSYAFSSMAGLNLQYTFAAGAAMQTSLSALFGGHVNVSVSKSASATTDFGISVNIGLDRTLAAVDTSGNVKTQPVSYDKVLLEDGTWANLQAPQPLGGLVDAYRFMTFYLAPESSNNTEFWSRVVNTQWLQSSDPNAVALRQVFDGQGAKTPPCWRVLHRVTFVSRVKPDQFLPVTPESPVIALDAGSHYLLVKQLEPYVRGATKDWPTLLQAVESALQTCYGAEYPALAQDPTATQVAELMAEYYGVTVPQ